MNCIQSILVTYFFCYFRFIWVAYVSLTFIHLFSNYQAVHCLVMTTLNTERFNILIKHFMEGGIIENPEKVNKEESILLGCGLSGYIYHIYYYYKIITNGFIAGFIKDVIFLFNLKICINCHFFVLFSFASCLLCWSISVDMECYNNNF